MMSLMAQLDQLAPHPDHPHRKSTLCVQVNNPHYKFENFLGSAFSEATFGLGSWAGNFGLSATDTKGLQKRVANMNVLIGHKKVIMGQFNQTARREAMMKAYLRDLPRRMGLERMLLEYTRKLNSLRQMALANPGLAA